MELGVYSFGDVQRDPATGELGSTAQAQRNLLEAIRLADEVGLDYFGIGEHHTKEMPASAATVVLGAAASVTRNIILGSAVTVLSTDDPVRVYQQFATLDALSNGRAEITAGRGSSTESFPLFGHSLNDYDDLYAEKLDLLLRINESEQVTWQGKFRPSLDNALVVLWLALTLYTGAFIAEIVRAGILAVSKGQSEAASALGLRPRRTMSLVILPQALRVIVPPLISQYLNLTKNSSLAIAVGYMDLRGTLGGTTLNQTGREMECMVLMMGIYLLLSLIISGGMNVFNSSVKLKER